MKRLMCIVISFVLLISSHVFAAQSLPKTTIRPLMLLPTRISELTAKFSSNSPDWIYLKGKADAYKTRSPESLYYGAVGRLAVVESLAFLMTNDTDYRDQGIEMLWARYFDPNSAILWNFQDRNTFRWGAIYAVLAYDYLYNSLSVGQKAEAQAAFVEWGEYWEAYISYPNYDSSFNPVDSDEGTSLACGMQFLAMALYGDNAYATTLFTIADGMLSDVVVGNYMSTSMAGGVWAEGSHYSPYTMRFFALQYINDKESRLIPYPNNYMELAAKSLIHMTFPRNTGTFMYGDVQNPSSDYQSISGDSRFDFMLLAGDAVEDTDTKAVVQDWLSTTTAPTADYYGIFRFIFSKLSPSKHTPAEAGWPQLFSAGETTGREFVSIRTGWGNTDSVLYYVGGQYTVDHVQKSAGDFAIVRNGIMLTKEVSGYGGVTTSSLAHNALLLANADDGSSSPTYRPVGYPTTLSSVGRNYGYIKSNLANAYNMTGYFAESPFDLVERQFIFTNSGLVFWSDLIINPTGTDCSWTQTGNVAQTADCSPREKKSIFHFRSLPIESNGVWSSNVSSEKITFESVYPETSNTLVDESILWSAEPLAELPENQKQYHLSIVPIVINNTEHFLNIIQTMSSGSAPVTTSAVDGGSTRGILAGQTVAMFGKLGVDINFTTYTVDATIHYVADLPINTKITVTRSGIEIVSDLNSGDNGVIEFTASSGSATYVVTTSNSTVILPPNLNIL